MILAEIIHRKNGAICSLLTFKVQRMLWIEAKALRIIADALYKDLEYYI